MELLDKYGDSDEAQEQIAREMGWLHELTEEEAEEEQRRIEEINEACRPSLDEPPPKPDPLRKLAGALHDVAAGHGHFELSFIVAYLKRALDHLHKSRAGLEAVAAKALLPADVVAAARRELFEIREGILALMRQFRQRS